MLWDSAVRQAFESSFDAVLAVDVLGEIIEHERTAAAILTGNENTNLTGQNLARLAIVDEHASEFLSAVSRLTSLPHDCETDEARTQLQLRLRTGQDSELLVDVSLCRLPDERTSAVNVFIRDASDRMKAEARLAQQTLQARLFQRATAFTLESDSYEDALRHSLGILSEITEWPVGHVYVPDAEGNSLVSSGIWHFEDGSESDLLKSKLGNLAFARGQGLPGQIWESAEPAWIADASAESKLLRGRVFQEAGVRGVFGFPVMIGDRVIAVMEFFSPETMTPDPQLLMMVGNIGSQLGRLMERSQAQEEQARQAAIVEASSDAIIGKSLDGTIMTWNKGAEHVYGYAAAEVIGREMSMLIPPDVQREEQEIADVAAHGRVLDAFETTRRRSDGTIIPVSISASPIRNRKGEIVGTASIERDITQRKQKETELERARDDAEAAARTKGQFLANVSHELRTPMNAIIGMIDLSFQEELTPRMRDYMETVRDASHTLLDLINDVLDFSRMEVGTFQLVAEPFNLRDVLDRSIRTLAIRANEKGLNLACRIHSDVPECLQGDSRRLRQIVINLVGNAIKFTDEGEVVVEVNVADSEPADGHEVEAVELEFRVEDTGVGIPTEFHQSIFEPFSQVDASSTRAHSGSGLGLAICRELIQKMGGDIAVESEPDKGSCFRFTATFRRATDRQIERLERFEPSGELIGLRVLVIDDNETNRTILEDLLTRWKMHPILADSGEAALAALRETAERQERFPLILLDALMPRMDGFMLLELADEEKLLEGATILMLSSAERQTLKDLCDEAPVAAFLEKPVSQSDLFDSIITALQGSGVRVESTHELPPAERPLRLLVAEDTPANQKVARLMLEQRGHDVTIVDNGQKAVEVLQHNAFDVVLMDVQMPVMDGLTATREIRALSNNTAAAIPIVALTAHAVAGDQERCLEAGMDAYVAKPIELFELIRTVEEVAGLEVGRLTATRTLTSDSTAPSRQDEPSGSNVFNYEVAVSRLNGNEELFRDMVNFFAEDAPRLLSEIETAIDAGNSAQIRRASHSLKGLCANFEAEPARDVALSSENAGRDGNFDLARELFPRLKAEVNRLKEALERF